MSTTAELEQNIEAFEAMRETLEEHHLHKFVVFHDAKFVDSFDSFHNAAREAVRRFGQGALPYPPGRCHEAHRHARLGRFSTRSCRSLTRPFSIPTAGRTMPR